MKPCTGAKRKWDKAAGEGDQSQTSTSIVTAKPSNEARGHTGYLTFARRIVREVEELEAVQPDITLEVPEETQE